MTTIWYHHFPMFSHLRGTIHRQQPGEVSVDVAGVGYAVTMPLHTWEELKDGATAMLWISPYVREDRFDLFGFLTQTDRTLFEELIKKQGIGPRIGLELLSFPRHMLRQAIADQDAKMLTSVKGIGRKTAEKLLVELKSMLEDRPHLFDAAAGTKPAMNADSDVVAALAALGYDTPTILRTIRELPTELDSTEARVTAALRKL